MEQIKQSSQDSVLTTKNDKDDKLDPILSVVNNKEDPQPFLDKRDRFMRIPLTEDELKMSVKDIAKKFGVGYSGAYGILKSGYSTPNSYKHLDKTNNLENEFFMGDRYVNIPLTEDELKMSNKDLAEKFNFSYQHVSNFRKNGYRKEYSPEYIDYKKIQAEKKEKNQEYFQEITPIPIPSVEAILANEKDQKEVEKIIEYFEINFRFFKKNDKYKKEFKLSNGEKLTYGDLYLLNKRIEKKIQRNDSGELVYFNKSENKFIPFSVRDVFEMHRLFSLRESSKNISKKEQDSFTIESLAPYVYKSGFYKADDFNRRIKEGTSIYDIKGPHERKLSPSNPSVFLSNDVGSANYYLGRDKFIGTQEKINHNTVRVSLLDNNTAMVTDTIHGRKIILYTFPLITKEQYEEKKKEMLERRIKEGKSVDINTNNHITAGMADFKLVPYETANYIKQNNNESDKDYNKRISLLSDISYVLGNFRSFMSETGLAANNYSWKDQLQLADALTKVKDTSKIVDFGKTFSKDGIRTFLSIEQGGEEMWNKIFALGDGEKLPEEIARKVFAKYGEIIDVADDTQKVIEELSIGKQSDNLQNEINNIRESMLVRAQKLLTSFYDKKENSADVLLKDLERYKTTVLLYADTYKRLKDSGNKVRLEDFKDTEIVIMSQEEKDKTANELWDITKANRPFIKDEYKIEKRKKEFFETIRNQFSEFYVLKHKGEIVAFCSSTPDQNGDLYIESLNVESEIKGASLGSEFFPAVIEKIKDRGHDIYGHVHTGNKGILPYYERLGFQISEIDKNGEIKYEIRIPKKIILAA